MTKPTREDLITLGYLNPGDCIARAPKRERKIWLTKSDKKYAERHGLTNQEMIAFKKDMLIDEEIIRDHHIMAAKNKIEIENSPQSHYPAW